MTQKKKKKRATRELLVGGGVLALFSPLILFALLGAGIGFSVLLTVLLAGVDIPDLGLGVLAYGILFVIMLFLLVKFSIRFRLLLWRLIGIFRERRRYQNTVDNPPAETSLDDNVLHHYATDQQEARERTEYR